MPSLRLNEIHTSNITEENSSEIQRSSSRKQDTMTAFQLEEEQSSCGPGGSGGQYEKQLE